MLVTGAASGIGRATALEVVARGGSVLGLDRSMDGLAETSALVQAAGGRIEAIEGDVADEDTVAAAVAHGRELPLPRRVVTPASSTDRFQPVENVPFETFMHTL